MFAFSFVINKKKGQNIVFYAVTMVILGVAIFLTQTRGVWIALIFSLLIFFLKKPKIYLVVLLVLGLFFVAFQGIIVSRLLTVKNFSSDLSSLGRLQAWIATISLLKANYITGYGFDSFIKLRDNAYSMYLVPVIHSHNTYLRSLLEMGLIGTVFYFSFLFRALYFMFKIKSVHKNSDSNKIIDGLQLSFLSMFVVFMFEPYFSLFGCSTIVIWFMISLAYRLYYQFYYLPDNSDILEVNYT
jgi:O-antigen ligase